MSTSLLLLLLIPLLGAIFCPMLPSGTFARGWALAISLATLLIAVVLGFARGADTGEATFALHGWTVAGVNFGFRLGCDAISYWLVLLTAVLQPLAIAASFVSIK